MLNSIKFGLELYDKYKDDNNLKKALYDNLKRELYFNIEIITEANKKKDEEFVHILSLLKTDYYEYLKLSLIDINKIYNANKVDFEQIIDKEKLKDKRFKNWVSNIKNDIELIEKIYLKINILKELSSVNITKREVSYRYLKFLLIILKMHLNIMESKG